MARSVHVLTILAVIVWSCGGQTAGMGGAEGQSPAGGTGPGGTATPPRAECVAIATEYLAALQTALVCDPAAADPCGEQRPLVMSEGTSTADAKITGLCLVGGAGYVNPASTAALDRLLLRYAAAGCTVEICPGLAPHVPRCAAGGGSATPTCG